VRDRYINGDLTLLSWGVARRAFAGSGWRTEARLARVKREVFPRRLRRGAARLRIELNRKASVAKTEAERLLGLAESNSARH
jgi:hypothetical protein